MQGDDADVGQFEFAGVDDLHGEDFVAHREGGQLVPPVLRLIQPIGDHHHERSPPRDCGRLLEQQPDGGGCGISRRRIDPLENRHQMLAALSCGDGDGAVCGGDHRAHAVSGAGGQEADPGCGGQRQVALLPLRRAEVEAGGTVGDDPRFEFPIGDRLTDVGLGGSSGDRPVDPSNVVARRVDAGLSRF